MNIKIEDKVFVPFIDKSLIEAKVKALSQQINNDYKDKKPILIGILNGCFLFMSDLVKELVIECETTFVKVSSYHGGIVSSGVIKEQFPLLIDIKDRDVILIEDIIDTGKTLKFLIEDYKKRNPASIKVVSLLLKPKSLEVNLPEMAYIGFEIENEFVLGYGMDFMELGRNTKDIYKLSI